MAGRPLIFITNDDGVNAKGLRSIASAACRIGDVIVVAPETAQSGMSHAITLNNPLYLREVESREGLSIYACSGTPVDCVKMFFDYLAGGRKVDLAVSGINHGSNSTISVLYSGTMGAAIESSFYGCPAVGLSLLEFDPDADFDAAVYWGERIMRQVLEEYRGGEPLCLNVNVPAGRPETLRGVRICRQSRGYWREEFCRREDPRGRRYFWLTGEFCNAEPDAEDTDEWALAHGYVSVVPVQVDMTDHGQLAALKKFIK